MIKLINCGLRINLNHKIITPLKNINLEIKSNDKIAVYGKNGSGKTLLLKLIAKKIFPTSGTVQNNARTAFLEYGSFFNEFMTGRQNAEYTLLMYNKNKNFIREALKKIKKITNLGLFFDEQICKYSRGMKQRLKFICSLFLETDVLVVDEGLRGGVDKEFQKEAHSLLREYLNDKTLILASHSLNDIKFFTKKFIHLENESIKSFTHDINVVKNYFIK